MPHSTIKFYDLEIETVPLTRFLKFVKDFFTVLEIF